jgi:exodeoxyribonuclease VII large subunit
MQRASLKQYSSSLNYAIQRHLLLQNSTARQLIGRLRSRHPSQQLESRKQQRVRLNTELTRQIRQRLREARAAVTHQQKLLTSLGPAETLNRGYALISDAAGKVVRGPDEVATGDALQIRMKGGRISTEVTAVDAN